MKARSWHLWLATEFGGSWRADKDKMYGVELQYVIGVLRYAKPEKEPGGWPVMWNALYKVGGR